MGEEEARQKILPFREDGMAAQDDSTLLQMENRKALGAIGKDAPSGKGKEEESSRQEEVQDPLEGMPPIDKWGLKGLHTLMNNFPDYNALTVGIDPATLGIELGSPEYGHLLSGYVKSTNKVQAHCNTTLLALRRCAATARNSKISSS
jgi:CCR4-NOT transcription complex subunit 2